MYQTFEYSLNDGIGLVRLNRPAKLNSIDPVMVREFGELVAAVRVDKNVRVLVFTGNGRAFYAGADISVLNDAANSGAFMSYIETIQTTFTALDDQSSVGHALPKCTANERFECITQQGMAEAVIKAQ